MAYSHAKIYIILMFSASDSLFQETNKIDMTGCCTQQKLKIIEKHFQFPKAKNKSSYLLFPCSTRSLAVA